MLFLFIKTKRTVKYSPMFFMRTVILSTDLWTVLESRPYFSSSAVGVLPSQNVIILSNYYVYKMDILQLIKVKTKTIYSWCFFFLSSDIRAGLKQFFAMFETRSDVCHFKTIHELFVYLWMCSGNEITRNIKGKKA